MANKKLHKQQLVIVNGKQYRVQENIFKERAILKYLTSSKEAPKSIVKYIDWFEDDYNYFLVMEHGGHPLFDFTIKVHEYIKNGQISINEWHKMVQILFNQMVNTVLYLHRQNVSHFDISLENYLINDVMVEVSIDPDTKAEKLSFVLDDIQSKLCDFGLAELFENGSFICSKFVGKSNYKSPEVVARKKGFCAKSNDAWTLGITLFMLIFGGNAWQSASLSDEGFVDLMNANGNIMKLVKEWNKSEYVDKDLVDLFCKIFQYEDERVSVSEIKSHPWMNKKL